MAAVRHKVLIASGSRLFVGENLNEHVIGQGWPSIDIRHEMLAEAIHIIRRPELPTHAHFDAGFTHVAVVQIGGEHQEPFFPWAERELLPALRQLG